MALKRSVRDVAKELIASSIDADVVSRVMTDLQAVADAFSVNPSFLSTLDERTIPLTKRQEALMRALKGHVHAFVMNALLLLQESRSLDDLESFVLVVKDEARRLAHDYDVCVTSAAALSTSDRNTIEKSAVSKLGGSVRLQERVDPNILGGFILESGDWRLDASVLGKIRRLKKSLYV